LRERGRIEREKRDFEEAEARRACPAGSGKRTAARAGGGGGEDGEEGKLGVVDALRALGD